MSELKITKGNWKIDTTPKWPFTTWIEGDNEQAVVKMDMYHYSTADNSIEDVIKRDPINNIVLANAKLIADAGTTYNKCSLLPSELLDRNNELLEALKNLKTNYVNHCDKPSVRLILEIDSLINKSTL